MLKSLYCALIIIVSTGCGGSDLPELGQVNGTVKLDGNPLANARVSFNPENGRGSSGVTNDSGEYELYYIATEKGAVLGNHSVSIVSEVDPEVDAETIVELSGDTGVAPPKPVRKKKEPIPAKYNSKTELKADVTGGDNTINFDLKSK